MRASKAGGMTRQSSHQRDDRRLDRGKKIVEMNDLGRPWKIFQPLLHRARGDDRFQFRLRDGGLDRFAAAGEVEIHRSFSGKHDGEIGHESAFARRQDDADALFARCLQMTRQARSRRLTICRAKAWCDPSRR